MTDDSALTTPEARFGAYLKREREMRRVELPYVANFSRIPHDRLLDLEAGRWECFGAFIYLRGAVFNYARAVGLDVDDLLLRLESEVPVSGKASTTPLATSANPLFRKSPEDVQPNKLAPLLILGGIGSAIVAMAWMAMQREIEHQDNALPAESAPIAVDWAAAPVSDANLPLSAPTAVSAVSAPVVAPAPISQPAKPQHVLEVRALDTAWLEYNSDDGATRTAVLNAGDKIRIRAKKSIRIRSGNAGGVELYLNGVKQAPLGDPGAVRERRFDLK